MMMGNVTEDLRKSKGSCRKTVGSQAGCSRMTDFSKAVVAVSKSRKKTVMKHFISQC